MADVELSRPDSIGPTASVVAGAPGTEIEVTPEMIEAGLDALYGFHISEPDDDEMREAVRAVFKSMIREPRKIADTSQPRRRGRERL